ncbi:MAG TPA: family 16 glycoside hydrolase [Planctomycetota bacterium]|nr:family 16 glycoside hydrolase [Planctomycetota bacterium]
MRRPLLLLVLAVPPLSAQQPAPPAKTAALPAPLPVLLVSGANNHDWKWTTPQIQGVLEETGRFAVTVTEDPARDLADSKALPHYAVIVLNYNGPRWGEAAENNFLAAVRGGVGVTVIHAANNAFEGWVEYEKLVGLLWRQGTGHGAYHPFDVKVTDHEHPITAGMADMHLHPDELYHKLVHMHDAPFRVLLTAFSDLKTGGSGQDEPMATVATYGQGRVFHTPLGHTWTGQLPTQATWFDPQLRQLVARGTEWAATGAVTLDPLPPNFLSGDEQQQGFALLFDGRSLQGWHDHQRKDVQPNGWAVRGSTIFHPAGSGERDLVSDQEYGDFDLRFQWRIGKGGNSGVMFHVQDSETETYMTGPEYQLLDDLTQKPDPKHAAAALYDLVPAKDKQVRPAGAWNDGRIVVQKGRVQHWLNGKQVVDAPCAGPEWEAMVQASKFKDWPFGRASKGRLALQYHGDEVAFRSVRLRAL